MGGHEFDRSPHLIRIVPMMNGFAVDPEREAIRIALIISKQEEVYGVNMYETLTDDDSDFLDELLHNDYEMDNAVLVIFERNYGKVPIPSERDIDDRLEYHSHVLYRDDRQYHPEDRFQ